MNEEIRQLILQARAETAEGSWKPPTHIWVERFAELIIRECADLQQHDNVLAPVGHSAWGEAYQDGWIEGTERYRDTILNHFGVEK